MSVQLPSTPGIRSARLRLLDWGGDLVPPLGGPVQHISRLGSRFAIDVELPPLSQSTDGRTYISRLRRAKEEGALFAFPQHGLVIGSPGAAPKVKTAVAGGTSVVFKGLTVGYEIREGQFFSFIHSGKRYLHSAQAAVTANGSGEATVSIHPMLRTNLSVDDVIEIAAPMIEGLLSGNEVAWDVMWEPFNSVRFTITETQ